MKIKVVKEHPEYSIGKHEVTDERGNYLIRVGVAEEVKHKDEAEKSEHKDKKEKVENVKHTPKSEK